LPARLSQAQNWQTWKNGEAGGLREEIQERDAEDKVEKGNNGVVVAQCAQVQVRASVGEQGSTGSLGGILAPLAPLSITGVMGKVELVLVGWWKQRSAVRQ